MKKFSLKLKLYFVLVLSLYVSLVIGGAYLYKPREEKVTGQISEQGVTDYSDEFVDEDTEGKIEKTQEEEPWVYTSADKDLDRVDKLTFRLAFGVKELKNSELGLKFKPKFPNTVVDTQKLPADYHKSMVTILGYEGHGSGFVFDTKEDGRALIMTNAHVVDQDSPTFAVLTYEGELLKVQKYELDFARDLAILEVYSNKLKAFPIATRSAVQREEVITIGTPGKDINTINSGKLLNNGERVSIDYGKNKKRYLFFTQIDAKVKEGNSGGPVLNTNGEVVGVICCVYKNKAKSGFIDFRDMTYRLNDYKLHDYFTRHELGLNIELQEKDSALGITKPGYRIISIKEGGLAKYFGLEAGDIITVVNGTEVPMTKANSEYFLNILNDGLGNNDLNIAEVLHQVNGKYELRTRYFVNK